MTDGQACEIRVDLHEDGLTAKCLTHDRHATAAGFGEFQRTCALAIQHALIQPVPMGSCQIRMERRKGVLEIACLAHDSDPSGPLAQCRAEMQRAMWAERGTNT